MHFWFARVPLFQFFAFKSYWQLPPWFRGYPLTHGAVGGKTPQKETKLSLGSGKNGPYPFPPFSRVFLPSSPDKARPQEPFPRMWFSRLSQSLQNGSPFRISAILPGRYPVFCSATKCDKGRFASRPYSQEITVHFFRAKHFTFLLSVCSLNRQTPFSAERLKPP